MKPLLLTLLAATLTPALAQPPAPDPIGTEPDFIFIQELNLWRTLQNHDLATFHALLLPDFLYIQKAIQTREQIMDNLNTCTLSNFKFRNHQLRMITPDIAILAYTASSETTCGESHLAGSYNATTTWVRRDGKWLVQIHTEVPIKP
ncbi:MAG: nuclear transport factor 2 family protein [Edaphobacter sp.]